MNISHYFYLVVMMFFYCFLLSNAITKLRLRTIFWIYKKFTMNTFQGKDISKKAVAEGKGPGGGTGYPEERRCTGVQKEWGNTEVTYP